MKKKHSAEARKIANRLGKKFFNFEVAVMEMLMKQPPAAGVTDLSIVLSTRPQPDDQWRKYVTCTVKTLSGRTYAVQGSDLADTFARALLEAQIEETNEQPKGNDEH